MKLRHFAAALTLSMLLLGGADAHASANYPEALRKTLELDAIAGPAPGCQLCHQDDAGGLRTATKPFGRALSTAGAMGGSVPSLLAALDTLDKRGSDSDADGTPDIAELRSGEDPNVGIDGARPEQVPLPQVGCGLAPVVPPSGLGLVVFATVLVSRGRRYRRRSR